MKEAILKAAIDFINYRHDDVVYIDGNETLFERLTSLYLEAGGTYEELREVFPEYF